MRRVLVVDDDPDISALAETLLRGAGFEVDSVQTCAQALEATRRRVHSVIVLDVRLPDGLGPDVMPQLLEESPDVAVIVSTGYGSTDLALACLQAGAVDFVQKGEIAVRLVPAVLGAMRDPDPDRSFAFRAIVGRSSAMRNMFHMLQPALRSRVPVLIRGESGTGKELVARALHEGGLRREGPFVAVNCAGIPEHLLEAELFGYERGAFTGAMGRKLGRFDLARGGTLLLDEVGELHPSLQAKLLRVLQDGEYQRLGGVETLQADVRVISATHRDLEGEVERGRFRQDLYYRLAVFTVDLPPLRERIGDIPLLVEHVVAKVAEREGRPTTSVEPMVVELLSGYAFPGNVRQLQNVVTHAVVSSRGAVVRVADLPAAFLRVVAAERGATPTHHEGKEEARGPASGSLGRSPGGGYGPSSLPTRTRGPTSLPPLVLDRAGVPGQHTSLPPMELEDPVDTEVGHRRAGEPDFPTLRDVEQRHVIAALERAGGNKALAARLLGISRMTLYRKLQEFDLDL